MLITYLLTTFYFEPLITLSFILFSLLVEAASFLSILLASKKILQIYQIIRIYEINQIYEQLEGFPFSLIVGTADVICPPSLLQLFQKF